MGRPIGLKAAGSRPASCLHSPPASPAGAAFARLPPTVVLLHGYFRHKGARLGVRGAGRWPCASVPVPPRRWSAPDRDWWPGGWRGLGPRPVLGAPAPLTSGPGDLSAPRSLWIRTTQTSPSRRRTLAMASRRGTAATIWAETCILRRAGTKRVQRRYLLRLRGGLRLGWSWYQPG
jgi:hypothetical protein